MFESLFTASTTTSAIEISSFVASIAVSLVLGLILALIYGFRSRHTRSFMTTLAVLPAIVCVIIAMVNGNVGAGVAVAGAFSLVRFRSAAGTARDIGFIFLAMCVGLVAGMGYVAYASLVTLILGGAYLIYQVSGFGGETSSKDRTLRITVPEDLDYVRMFDEVFARYTSYSELMTVKTTNMGSLYRLVYNVGLNNVADQKKFIDELRCRNANLEIALSHQEVANDEL